MKKLNNCVSVHPHFKIEDGKLAEFRALTETISQKVSSETKCLYYNFTFNGDIAFCREAYDSAEGVLEHLDNVGSLLEKMLGISGLTAFEIHGPCSEINKLREPLSSMNPEFFVF
jgi:hypothetical protein